MKKTKNVNIKATDAMLANFLVYFEENFKKINKMTPKIFSNMYSHIQENSLFYMVPFSELENSDMGWVIKKKKGIFILDEHVVASEDVLQDKWSGNVIMSRSTRDGHKWMYLPQIPNALCVGIEVSLECDKEHEHPFQHVGNVAEGIIAQKVTTDNKREHVLKHLQTHKWITDKQFHDLSKEKGHIRMMKNGS